LGVWFFESNGNFVTEGKEGLLITLAVAKLMPVDTCLFLFLPTENQYCNDSLPSNMSKNNKKTSIKKKGLIHVIGISF